MASSGGSNGKLIGVVVLVLATIGAAAYAFRSSGTEEVDPESTYQVKCTKCGVEWAMPASQYLSLAPKGTDVSGLFKCEKCGAADAVAKAKIEPKPANSGTEVDYSKWKEEALTLDQIRKARAEAGETGPTGTIGSTQPPKVPPKKVSD